MTALRFARTSAKERQKPIKLNSNKKFEVNKGEVNILKSIWKVGMIILKSSIVSIGRATLCVVYMDVRISSLSVSLNSHWENKHVLCLLLTNYIHIIG